MNTNVRFGGYAVRREFRRGLSFHGSLPPRDAPPAARVGYRRGANVSPYRTYLRYNLLYRTASSSYQGYASPSSFRRYRHDESDTAVFMARRARRGGDKQAMNRIHRRVFKQQLAMGLEAPSEFKYPVSLHALNTSW